MTLHKNHRRSQAIVDVASLRRQDRRLGRWQAVVLQTLLEHGTYPGTWNWRGRSETVRMLTTLHVRGLVDVEDVANTDWRGNRLSGTVTYYRPAKWMRDAMDADTEEEFTAILRGE